MGSIQQPGMFSSTAVTPGRCCSFLCSQPYQLAAWTLPPPLPGTITTRTEERLIALMNHGPLFYDRKHDNDGDQRINSHTLISSSSMIGTGSWHIAERSSIVSTTAAPLVAYRNFMLVVSSSCRWEKVLTLGQYFLTGC